MEIVGAAILLAALLAICYGSPNENLWDIDDMIERTKNEHYS